MATAGPFGADPVADVLLEDTIVATATPPGRGGIAVVRMSGTRAHAIAQQRVSPWPTSARRATLCTVTGSAGEVLDRALVTVFHGPHSFTGEDVVEIATHGGVITPTLVVGALIGAGAREALPGEFTRRAVLRGKLDLVQAEAIGDLIDARSRAMQASALRQLDGGLSRRITALRDMVIGVEALIAYDIDFPEEDDGPIPRERVLTEVSALDEALAQLIATSSLGEIIRDGAVVVIAGAPNAGKSSLFNALLGAQRAIVTAVPGTTRDALEAVLDMGRWPVRLVDTAGLRDTDDLVERLGIEVSQRYLASADVVLACGDSPDSVETVLSVLDTMLPAHGKAHGDRSIPIIRVRTKSDLPSHGATSPGLLDVSAVSGEGMAALVVAIEEAITARFAMRGAVMGDAPILTRERHRVALVTAKEEVGAFLDGWMNGGVPPSVAAVHLRAAAHALEDVVGAIDIEDVFDRLFGTFCVGK